MRLLRQCGLSAVIWATCASASAKDGIDTSATTSSEPESPTSLRVVASAGTGAGSVGLTGRLGLNVDYWLSEHWGVGLAGALIAQTRLSWLDNERESHGLVGPSLSLRTSSQGSYAFITGAAGYMQGTYSSPGETAFICFDSCEEDDPGESFDLRGVAGVVGIGFVLGEGAWRIGGAALVDQTFPSHAVELGDGTKMDAAVTSLTVNLTLNLEIY